MSIGLSRPCATAITAGATLLPWPKQGWWVSPLSVPCILPNDALQSTWIENVGEVKEKMCISCHDIWLTWDGPSQREVLLVLRREPGTRSQGKPAGRETAAMNGFWWPVGGRILRLPDAHPQGHSFGLVESAMTKAVEEIGLKVDTVRACYQLGMGLTAFRSKLQYQLLDPVTGTVFEKEVNLEQGLNTLNANLVFQLSRKLLEEEMVLNDSIETVWWVSRSEFELHRELFSGYVVAFLETIFEAPFPLLDP